MAGIANLSIDAGASFSSDVDVVNDDGTAFDLTDYTVTAKMSKGYSTNYEKVNFTVIKYPLEGIVTIELNATTTSQLEEGRWVYDVKASHNSDSTVTRLVEGIITVNPAVT